MLQAEIRSRVASLLSNFSLLDYYLADSDTSCLFSQFASLPRNHRDFKQLFSLHAVLNYLWPLPYDLLWGWKTQSFLHCKDLQQDKLMSQNKMLPFLPLPTNRGLSPPTLSASLCWHPGFNNMSFKKFKLRRLQKKWIRTSVIWRFIKILSCKNNHVAPWAESHTKPEMVVNIKVNVQN